LAIPHREANARGEELFTQVNCAVCHTPSLHTRADYPVEQIADRDAAVYTDFLLHSMGSLLADGLPKDPGVDGDAGSLDWRTAPLLGLRFNRTFLHDGRARTVADAIRLHRSDGSEANDSIDRFDALSDDDRKALLDFVNAL